MKRTKQHLEEIYKCKHSFLRFCRYLKIVDKSGKLISFKPNKAQREILSELNDNPWLSILKARQLGSSTFVAAYYLHKALFNKNHKVAVAAHTLEAVRSIFGIYKTYYDNLPKFLQLPTNNDNANVLKFKHGSSIKVGTPNSFRGSTYQSAHCSEVAFWANPKEDFAALLQTLGENPTVIMETTPNGLNDFYTLWNKQDGYSKLFLSWVLDSGYQRKETPKDITTAEQELLQSIEGINTQQKNWAIHTLRTKCAGNINTFKQEYASNPVSCFITSGTRVFSCSFPDAAVTEGLIEFIQPSVHQPYLMGVDTAEGGPNGDYSAFTILTREDVPKIVATYYARVDSYDFCEIVYQAAKKYNAFAVVEAGSAGYAVIDYLKRKEHPHLYRRMIKDKTTSELTEKLGFNTNTKTRNQLMSGLQELINLKKINIIDERLQSELNTFVYINGRMSHDKGRHDDMIFSLALAYAGYSQADYIVHEAKQKKPTNMTDMLAWEASTGLLYNEYTKEDDHSFTSLSDIL